MAPDRLPQWYRRNSSDSEGTLAEEREPLNEDYQSKNYKDRIEEVPATFYHNTNGESSIRLRTAIIQIITAVSLTAVLMLLFLGPRLTIDRNNSVYGNIPTNRVVFDNDPRFSESNPMDANSPWNALFPGKRCHSNAVTQLTCSAGRGFVRVENPSQHGLSGGYPLEEGSEGFETSMFHQLHCLSYLKSTMTAALSGDHGGHTQGNGKDLAQRRDYANHCFEYLRQAVMCAGDLTLEKAVVRNGEIVNGATTWNVTHECKDWRSMFEFADEHAYTAGKRT